MDHDELNARLGTLEATVEMLQLELQRRAFTMKHTLRCPCGGTTILQFRRIYETGYVEHHELSLINNISMLKGVSTSAPFEAYVCKACGLVEWHAVELDGVAVDGKHVVEHIAPPGPAPEPDPYR